MSNSIDELIDNLKQPFVPGRKLDVIQAQVVVFLYQALSVYGACLCERKFKYHGKTTKICGRCKAMIAYELLTDDTSKTLTDRETEIKK